MKICMVRVNYCGPRESVLDIEESTMINGWRFA